MRADHLNAGHWLRHGLESADPEALSRLGRLRFDARLVLACKTPGGGDPLIDSLVAQADDDVSFCRQIEPTLNHSYLEQPLLPLAIEVARTLGQHAGSDQEKARWLNNLSVHLADSGDRDAGLAAIRRAVDIIGPFATPGTRYAGWFESMKRSLAIREAEGKGD